MFEIYPRINLIYLTHINPVKADLSEVSKTS